MSETMTGIDVLFKKRILQLASKGMYPLELVSNVSPDLLPVVWDLTCGFDVSDEEVKEMVDVLKDEGEEGLVMYLIRRRSRNGQRGRKLYSEIDHAYALCFRELLNYITILHTRYLKKKRASTTITKEHLNRLLDLSLGIQQVLLDVKDMLPDDFWCFACNRVQAMNQRYAEDD